MGVRNQPAAASTRPLLRPRQWLLLAVIWSSLVRGIPAPSQEIPAGPAPPQSLTPDPTASKSHNCLPIHAIQDWRAIDPSHLLVTTGVRGWTHAIELNRRCPGLQFAERIRWDGTNERICGDGNDAVIVRGDRCTIVSIRPYAGRSE
jgi:hypothetical protein